MEPKQDLVEATPDGFGLGVSKGQRSAEVLAAGRAEKMPSPETKALSRYSGRLFMRLFLSLMQNKNLDAILNYVIVRTEGMRHLCIEGLAGKDNPIFVDIACGFSPRALFLAREQPHVRVIEVDQKSVLDEKRRRLQNAHIDIPRNLEWIEADLARIPLKEALNGQLVDVISAEGLLPYFPPEEVTGIGKSVLDCLKPGGSYIAGLAWREGINEVMRAMSFFSRQAGQLLCIVESEEEANQLFTDAGYESMSLHLSSDLAEKYDLPRPVVNFEVVVVAQKAAAQAPPVTTTEVKEETETNAEAIAEDKVSKVSEVKTETEASSDDQNAEDNASNADNASSSDSDSSTEDKVPSDNIDS